MALILLRTIATSIGEVVSFYQPTKDPQLPWDVHCGAGRFGNFPPSTFCLPYNPEFPLLSDRFFLNGEAAFQAAKLSDPTLITLYEDATGEEAYRLKCKHQMFADPSFVPTGKNWRAMLYVVRTKFCIPALIDLLKASGNHFLLEHNSHVGRDAFWSDNGDGEGRNWLGVVLMLVRDEINQTTGPGSWTHYLSSVFDLNTGAFLTRATETEWQNRVRQAATGVNAFFNYSPIKTGKGHTPAPAPALNGHTPAHGIPMCQNCGTRPCHPNGSGGFHLFCDKTCAVRAGAKRP